MSAAPLVRYLLGEPPLAWGVTAPRAAWDALAPLRARFPDRVEGALVSGLHAGGLGTAFVAGYGAAVAALCPELPRGRLACLSVTEATGNRPRDVVATYEVAGERLLLRGRKRWASLSPIADLIVLIVREPASPPERPRLRAVLLPRDTEGLVVDTMPATPFLPEVPHAELGLDGVSVEASALLPGDAYEERVKPFRSLEDLHVTAATLGHLIGVARRTGGAEPLVERLVALAAAAPGIAALGPSLPEAHLVLSGWLSAVRELAPALDALFARAPSGERERWERDRVLLDVAGRVRARRTERAWERLRAGAS